MCPAISIWPVFFFYVCQYALLCFFLPVKPFHHLPVILVLHHSCQKLFQEFFPLAPDQPLPFLFFFLVFLLPSVLSHLQYHAQILKKNFPLLFQPPFLCKRFPKKGKQKLLGKYGTAASCPFPSIPALIHSPCTFPPDALFSLQPVKDRSALPADQLPGQRILAVIDGNLLFPASPGKSL